MRNKILLCLLVLLVLSPFKIFSQGKNHNWLIGYTSGIGTDTNITTNRAILNFNNNQLSIIPENFQQAFRAGQANISDENGKLLICTNGCWISDSTYSQMQNGDSLNPGTFTNDWCDPTSGIPYVHSSVLLPFPADSNKYILFHETGNYNYNSMASELYYSIIDLTLNNGLGAVTQKNQIAIQDSLTEGMAACKHANGRDWWVVILKDHSDIAYKLLVTPNGIDTITNQHLNVPIHEGFNGQPQFSPDGTTFAYHYYHTVPGGVIHSVRIFNFDRCTGVISLKENVSIVDSFPGIGLAFSSNSKYLYFSTFRKIFQLNVDTNNILSSLDTVSIYDGYCYPDLLSCTSFWFMYLAADSKIYVTSGSGVIDLNYINYPDSIGLSCDVHQHAIRTPCYTGRGNVNHPNYYLGPVVGSVCDSLAHVGLQEHLQEIQNFKIAPNPIRDEQLKITYLLPQNKSGVFEIYDLNGRVVFSRNLEPWSSLQYYNLPFLESGLYQCVVRSEQSLVARKLAVIH